MNLYCKTESKVKVRKKLKSCSKYYGCKKLGLNDMRLSHSYVVVHVLKNPEGVGRHNAFSYFEQNECESRVYGK